MEGSYRLAGQCDTLYRLPAKWGVCLELQGDVSYTLESPGDLLDNVAHPLVQYDTYSTVCCIQGQCCIYSRPAGSCGIIYGPTMG